MRLSTTLGTCLLAVALAAACPLPAADLLDIYELAARQDARLKAAQAEFQATEELRPQALSALLPQFNLDAQYARAQLDIEQEASIDSVFGPSPARDESDSFNSYGYTLRLDQVIYDHALVTQLRQSGSNVAQARAQLDAVLQELIVRVTAAYFNVLAAQDNVDFRLAEKDAIGRQLEQAQKRFEVGMIAITDVKEAQAAYDLAFAQEVVARNQLAVDREALQVITGQLSTNLTTLGNDIPLVAPDPADIEQWVMTAIDQNAQLMAARFAVEVASYEVTRRQAGHYPTLGLFAEKVYDDSGGSIFGAARTTDDERFGVQLTFPLFSGGLVTSSTREASYLLEQARALQVQERRETVRETRASFLSVIAGINQVKALAQALASNQAAADAAEAGFEVGTRTSVDVLLALRDLFRTRRDLSRARYDYLLDTLRLKQAAGTLISEDLMALNAWLSSRAPGGFSSIEPASARWAVQVGSFTEIENAEALRDELQAAGFAAFKERAVSAGEQVFRVMVGPEKDLRDAGALQTRLRAQEGLDGIVVSRYPSAPDSPLPRRLD